MSKLSASSGKQALDDVLRTAVDSRKVPAVFFGVTNADETIYANCAGEKTFGDEADGQVNEDTTLQLFSSTKLLTTISCLQLLDRGLLKLDDPELIKTHLPEIAKLRILKGYTDDEPGKGEPIWEDSKTDITLRMLLTHTSGMGYTFNSPDLQRWTQETSHPSFLAANAGVDAYAYPLISEPSTKWHYSVGIDWAGILVMRLSGLTLEEYMKKNIFEPCGMSSTTFIPTEDIKKREMRVTYLDPTSGKLKAFPDNYGSLPHAREGVPEKIGVHAGGAGLYGTAKDYLAFLRGVLASDPSRQTDSSNKALISGDSFEELFKDTIPAKVPKTGLLTMMRGQSYHDPSFTEEEVGHSVGLCLNLRDSMHGRKKGSGCWDGAAKTQYWLDPASGIAAICFTNIFVPNPNPFMDLYNKFERAVYDNLE